MNRLSFSRTQILILVSVWLTFLISFVMRLSWASLMPIVNEALSSLLKWVRPIYPPFIWAMPLWFYQVVS